MMRLAALALVWVLGAGYGQWNAEKKGTRVCAGTLARAEAPRRRNRRGVQ